MPDYGKPIADAVREYRRVRFKDRTLGIDARARYRRYEVAVVIPYSLFRNQVCEAWMREAHCAMPYWGQTGAEFKDWATAKIAELEAAA